MPCLYVECLQAGVLNPPPKKENMAEQQMLERPEVSVTFRLSEAAHKAMIEECALCACNVSGFIRAAVMNEIVNRRSLRKRNKDYKAPAIPSSLAKRLGLDKT